jgi:hypothetical protein
MTNKVSGKSASKKGANKGNKASAVVTVLDINAPELSGPAGKLFDAVTVEITARNAAGQAIAKASAAAWASMVPVVRDAVKELGPVNAKVILDGFRSRCTLAGEEMKRGIQYASDLGRIVRAAVAGKEIPASVFSGGRDTYLNDPFWQASGILKKTGPTKGKGKAGKAEAEAAGESVGTVAAKANKDKAWQEICTMLATLRGPFKAEAYAAMREVLLGISEKQALATGNGKTGTK